MRTVEVSGRTIEEAKQKAAAKLGVPEHDIEFEVLEVGARGFLGLIGGSSAKVRGTYYETKHHRHSAAQASPRQGSPIPPDEDEGRPARGRRRGGRTRDGRERPPQRPPQNGGREPSRQEKQEKAEPRSARKPAGQQGGSRSRPTQPRAAERQAPPPAAEPDKPAEAQPPRRERQPRRAARPKEPAAPVQSEARPATESKPTSTGATALSIDARAEEALSFIKTMIDAGELGATAKISEVVEDGFEIDIDGGRSELLVGRQGSALDALQFLVGIIVNRKHDGKVRITVDAAGFRRKHREALEKVALEFAEQVKLHDQEAELEPQPARDRRIIHNVLKEHPDVYTYSEGEGDQRHVVISPKKA